MKTEFKNWYFGEMSRQSSTDLLMREREGGVFLVRDSSTIQGDYVLCVKEDDKVSHYIINKIDQNEQTSYRIGDQEFPDLPSLLNFYKLHYLDTTPLTRPAVKRSEKILAKYDFTGNDPDDLPFKKGDILTVVSKDEDQWWTARNSLGQTGSIPVPYMEKVQESIKEIKDIKDIENDSINSLIGQKSPPTYARVKQARVPNAYDKTALRLKVGDLVKVTKMAPNGQWEGEMGGKLGHFPFTHVEIIDSESGVEDVSS